MTPDPQLSDPVNMLTKLPEELVMLVMAKLDPLSLANLERTSTALQSIIQEGNLWKRMADDANKADPYPFITGMLKYASMRQIADCRAFKIILGARREIEQIVEGYQREMKELRMQEVHDIRIVLIEKSVGQVKALSRKHLMMEEKDYPVMSEHRFSRYFLIEFLHESFQGTLPQNPESCQSGRKPGFTASESGPREAQLCPPESSSLSPANFSSAHSTATIFSAAFCNSTSHDAMQKRHQPQKRERLAIALFSLANLELDCDLKT